MQISRAVVRGCHPARAASRYAGIMQKPGGQVVSVQNNRDCPWRSSCLLRERATGNASSRDEKFNATCREQLRAASITDDGGSETLPYSLPAAVFLPGAGLAPSRRITSSVDGARAAATAFPSLERCAAAQ
jgi:hypothetical protein